MGHKKKIAGIRQQEKPGLSKPIQGTICGVSWFEFIFPFAFLAGGLFLDISSQYDAHIAHQAMNWPGTSGEVVSTKVVEHKSTSHSQGRHGGGSSTSHTRYALHIVYTYSVYGIVHSNDRIHIGERGNKAYDGSEPEEWGKEHYPVGKIIKVYYNPDSPDQAVLIPGVATITYVLLLVSCLMFGLSFFYFRTIITANRENRPTFQRRFMESAAVVLIFIAVNILVFPGGIRL